MKLVKGVGYNSGGKHLARKDGSYTRLYHLWRTMLARCYCDKMQARQPTYIGCTVDERWHDFQNYAEWYTSNEFFDSGYQLDKDVLIKGNKIYSPDTCCLIPQELNKLLLDRKASRGKYPRGVIYERPMRKYLARVSVNGRDKHVGYFKCPNEAHAAYVVAKEAHVKEKALEWRGRIDERVFEALMSWTLY